MNAYGARQILAAGGVVLLLLVGLSVYSLALMWERWKFYSAAVRGQSKLLDKLRKAVGDGDLNTVLAQCQVNKGAASEVLLAALVGPPQKDERRRCAERALERHVARLERGIGALGTIGSIAPFIGLFGTVIGVMRAFRDLAGTAGAGPGVVAVGISEALITTAAGLFVAIPAIVGYNYFTTRITRFADELRWMSDEILDHLTEKSSKA